jgi:hypothetical protein
MPEGPAIEIRGGVIGREDGFELRKISTIDPEELTVSDIKILSHMTHTTTVIKDGVVSTHHIWYGMTAAPLGLHKV